MTPEQEIAWAAGLFEGEGCISTYQSDSTQLTLVSTDYDVIDRFARIVGVGTVSGPFYPNNNPEWKPVKKWLCSHQYEVRELLDRLLPFLCGRRAARAQGALDLFHSRPRRNIKKARHKEAP